MLAHRMGKRCAAEDERRARSALCLPSWGDETHWIPLIALWVCCPHMQVSGRALQGHPLSLNFGTVGK